VTSDICSAGPLGDMLDAWSISMGVHPALSDLVVAGLISMADSTDEGERFRAACHPLMPQAKLVTMQNDTSERIREVVKRILAYEEENK
jgi:hypothetical protein